MRMNSVRLPGVHVLELDPHEDPRGSFLKLFSEKFFASNNLETEFKEVFVSTSQKDVLRGMHFQLPPMAQTKVVSVLKGQILDVVVDLRIGSPSYGECERFFLSEDNGLSLYVGTGFAHGFLSLVDENVVVYLVSENYDKELDTGILWNSFGFDWGMDAPIISERDRSFPTLKEFRSPFRYTPETGRQQ